MKKIFNKDNAFNILIGVIVVILIATFALNFQSASNADSYLFLISTFTTSITTIFVVKNSSKDASRVALSQTVSHFRSDWLVKVKDTYSNFEYLIESFYNDEKLDEQEYKNIIVLKNKLLVEFNAYRDISYDLATRLNLISSYLYQIKKDPENKDNIKKVELIKKTSDDLFIFFNAYFKIEWKRIKFEVTGVKIDFIKEFYEEVENVKRWYKEKSSSN